MLPIESGPRDRPVLSPEASIDALAACLYSKMERLDPSGRGLWEELTEPERDFYRESVRELLREKNLLNLAMDVSSDSPTTT